MDGIRAHVGRLWHFAPILLSGVLVCFPGCGSDDPEENTNVPVVPGWSPPPEKFKITRSGGGDFDGVMTFCCSSGEVPPSQTIWIRVRSDITCELSVHEHGTLEAVSPNSPLSIELEREAIRDASLHELEVGSNRLQVGLKFCMMGIFAFDLEIRSYRSDGDQIGVPTRVPVTVHVSDCAVPGQAKGADVAGEGDEVWVIWQDTRADSDERDIYANHSTNGGLTWPHAAVRLNTDSPGEGYSKGPRVHAAGDTAHAVWAESREVPDAIYYNHASVDGAGELTPGASDLRLDELVGASNPRICGEGERVYVVWQSGPSGDFGVRFSRSLEGGDPGSWLDPPRRLDSYTRSFLSPLPRVACVGDEVYVVWQRGSMSGSPDSVVLMNRSPNGGHYWKGESVVGGPVWWGVNLACDGHDVYVAWKQVSGIRVRHFDSRTESWSEAVEVNGSADAQRSFGIVCAGSKVAVAWESQSGGISRVHLNLSTAHGTEGSWQETALRLDENPDEVGHGAFAPRILGLDKEVHVAWHNIVPGGGQAIQARRVAWATPDDRGPLIVLSSSAGKIDMGFLRSGGRGSPSYFVWARSGVAFLNVVTDGSPATYYAEFPVRR